MVTGGAGFIGSNFIRFLLEKSDFAGRIVNVDSLTYAGNLENLADIGTRYPDRYVFARADICDLPAIGRILDAHRIDAVCHFAAESHVDRSIAAPDGFIQTNIIGTFNLLELVRERLHRIQRFHHVSTDEVYGSLGSGGHFKEDTPMTRAAPIPRPRPLPTIWSTPITGPTAFRLPFPTVRTITDRTSSRKS